MTLKTALPFSKITSRLAYPGYCGILNFVPHIRMFVYYQERNSSGLKRPHMLP